MKVFTSKNKIFFQNNYYKKTLLYEGESSKIKGLMRSLPRGASVPKKVVWLLETTKQHDRAEKARKYFKL